MNGFNDLNPKVLIRSHLFSHASHLAWIRIKKMEKVLLFLALLADVTLCLLFNCLGSLKLHRPDVRTFLLMDKMQNFSDASEDEDDKVSTWSTNLCINFFFSSFIFLFSCWLHLFSWGNVYSRYSGLVRSSTSVFVMSRLCQRGVNSALYLKV